MSALEKFKKQLSGLGISIAGENYFLDKYRNEDSKLKLVQANFFNLLRISTSMFKYENLPDEIPEDILEQRVQMSPTIFAKANDGKVYNLMGSVSELDANYLPKYFIVSNPYLKTKNKYEINKDCVLYYNDYQRTGLYDLTMKYATLLADIELSMYISSINIRASLIFSAEGENVKNSVEVLYNNLWNGYNTVVLDSTIVTGENFKVQNGSAGAGSVVQPLIEMRQYVLASYLNEIGINANYNMKREAINSNESQLNTDMLRPLCDQMLDVRKKQIEKVNEMFGLNITVDFNDVWKTRQINDVETTEEELEEEMPEQEPEPGEAKEDE